MKISGGGKRQCRLVRKERAFSLIEVLVTLVIISVAALGTAGLQTVTLRINNGALLESQAATLAQDIVERIRANPDGAYATVFDAANLLLDAPVCEGPAADCDSVEMAQHDLVDWKCALGVAALANVCDERGIAGQLPDGDGSITVAGNTYTTSIRWFDSASGLTMPIVFTASI